MNLNIDIEGISDSFTASSFYYSRKLGEPVLYGITLTLNHANSHLLESISKQLAKEKTHISLSWQHNKIVDKLELTRCNYIDNPAEPRLLLVCHCNKYQTYKPGAHQPRKRILKAANLLDFFRKYFSSLIEMDNTIERALEQIKFPDKEKTNMVQFLKTDHEMLTDMVKLYNSSAPVKETIVLSGAAKNDRFTLKWAQQNKCTDLQYLTKRKLDDKISSALKPALRIGYQNMRMPECYKSQPQFQNIVYIANRGNYAHKEWEDWKIQELPAFYKDAFVCEIEDRFTDTRDGEMGWESRIVTIPKADSLQMLSASTQPWAGTGKVITRSPVDFWMEAELEGFEKDAKNADVRITSIYSGHHGNAGLHLVPEKNTQVQIFKGSDWMSPIMLINNVRSEKVVEKAPFWKLEDETKWDFQSTHLQVKDITTQAADTVTVKTKGVTTKIDNSKMEIS